MRLLKWGLRTLLISTLMHPTGCALFDLGGIYAEYSYNWGQQQPAAPPLSKEPCRHWCRSQRSSFLRSCITNLLKRWEKSAKAHIRLRYNMFFLKILIWEVTLAAIKYFFGITESQFFTEKRYSFKNLK